MLNDNQLEKAEELERVVENIENELPSTVLYKAINYYKTAMGLHCIVKSKSEKLDCLNCPMVATNGLCMLCNIQTAMAEYDSKIIKGG